MSKKILVVEDDKEIQEMFKFKFEKWGFMVDVADDGFSALNKAVEFKPDLILLDIMMPDMDWFETLKTIKKQTSLYSTKIVIFSNLKTQENIDKAFDLGADDYLVKADTTPAEVYQKAMKMFEFENPQNTVEAEEQKENNEGDFYCPHCNKKIKINLKKW